MTLFELTFGLTAIILGLALTAIAASLHRLTLAGRKVRWAPEPLLLASLVTTIIFAVWLGNWYLRDLKTCHLLVLTAVILAFSSQVLGTFLTQPAR
ncbi:MAG: hypothetical protein ABIR87_08490 [Sphingomicrobium sp.]